MRTLTECLVCGGSAFLTVYEATYSGGADEAPEYFLAHRRKVAHGRIQRCGACGFLFTNPQFESHEYDTIYKNAPGPEGTDVVLDAAEMRRFQRLARLIRSDAGEGGRFLDLGCGRGGFLEAMNSPKGIGFEVGDPGERRAGPSTILTGNFLDMAGSASLAQGAFDFVTAFDVFEHLPDLPAYLEALKRLIRPGGSLIVTVPNAGSLAARLTGEKWNMYLLEHLWFFDRKTLSRVVERFGFSETTVRSLPYDAPVIHILRRVAQTYGLPLPTPPRWLSDLVLPVPIGVMYAVYRNEETPAAADGQVG